MTKLEKTDNNLKILVAQPKRLWLLLSKIVFLLLLLKGILTKMLNLLSGWPLTQFVSAKGSNSWGLYNRKLCMMTD
jgi:hypothetical protein